MPNNPEQNVSITGTPYPSSDFVHIQSCELLLNQIEDELGYDGGMAVLAQVLRDRAVVEITPIVQHILFIVFL